jgi:adenosylcobyric acid synthase
LSALAPGLHGAVMVCGTSSGAGKSTVVAGLCRLLARRGVRVAPFKAQNMSNNAAVCADGAEIGRAQYAQAVAAGIEPSAECNPILLKPIDDRRSQVIVNGRPFTEAGAADYADHAAMLLDLAADALQRLRQRFDVVVVEGAGSPAELNLLERDVSNLPLAARAGIDALLVADVDRGGMLAAAYGTVALLPPSLRERIRGIVVNRFRGDAALLRPGLDLLEQRSGVRMLGVVPFLPGAVDAEDSLDVPTVTSPARAGLEVAVVRLPRISNFTDLEPLAAEPDVGVRYVSRPDELAGADLVVVPGSRAVVADLAWLRHTGLADAIVRTDAVVLGICGGYQMLGEGIVDDAGVEGEPGSAPGLGLLPVATRFARGKVTRVRRGRALGCAVEGYEIRHGVPVRTAGDGWIELDDGTGTDLEGATRGERIFGTSLHGLFEGDGFRHEFLRRVAEQRGRQFAPGTESFADARARFHDRLADALEANLDLERLAALVAAGAPAAVAG